MPRTKIIRRRIIEHRYVNAVRKTIIYDKALNFCHSGCRLKRIPSTYRYGITSRNNVASDSNEPPFSDKFRTAQIVPRLLCAARNARIGRDDDDDDMVSRRRENKKKKIVSFVFTTAAVGNSSVSSSLVRCIAERIGTRVCIIYGYSYVCTTPRGCVLLLRLDDI